MNKTEGYLSIADISKFPPITVNIGDWRGEVVPMEFLDGLPPADVVPREWYDRVCKECDRLREERDHAISEFASYKSWELAAKNREAQGMW